MNLYPNNITSIQGCSSTKNDNLNFELLRDVTSTGKERDWKNKKARSLLMAEHFSAADLVSKAERVCNCGQVLKFKKTIDGRLKLYQAYFCKVRLCPMCNWRRSLKIAYQNKLIVERVNATESVTWLFLTLTVKNVEGQELKSTINDMMAAWNNFSRYAKFKSVVKGSFRALEVTKNRNRKSKAYGTYHPHFHVLLCVPKSYFQKKYYISQDEWASMWQKALKSDYKPIVDVRRVKPKKESLDALEVDLSVSKAIQEQNAILEVSKYPVKDTDVIRGDKVTKDNLETVLAFDDALARKRLIAYGGLLKQIHQELNLDDGEDGNLISVSEDNDEIANGIFEVVAYWHVGLKNYVIQE